MNKIYLEDISELETRVFIRSDYSISISNVPLVEIERICKPHWYVCSADDAVILKLKGTVMNTYSSSEFYEITKNCVYNVKMEYADECCGWLFV